MAPPNDNDSPSLAEFCCHVPLRLSSEERSLLTVLENTLKVSEYTDHVDVASARRGVKARRILDGILEACHISTGLAVSSGREQSLACVVVEETRKKKKKSFRHGKKKKKKDSTSSSSSQPLASSWAGRDPKENAALFQTMFEIGRRNKVLNPSQMRTTYGKLMYLLQDAQNPTVAKSLGFSLHKDLVLVGSYLEQFSCTNLLRDDRLVGATRCISSKDENGKRLDRSVVEKKVAKKRALKEQLCKEYSNNSKMTLENVDRCIESISDAIAVVELNVAPIKQMLEYLENNFDPSRPEDGFSLALSGSRHASSSSNTHARYGLSAFNSSSGPTLSHSHSTQYTFVWQSLRLWNKVQNNMHKLWVCADEDLLSTSTTYHLYNTGQGLNRVQSCPRVGKVMRSLLNSTQLQAGAAWVGLSVIHLGDRDVPNALVFIDKYTQIPRFLSPICNFLEGLEELCTDERVRAYIYKQFGSQHNLKMTVLCDYFKHGFDGSGDDGGSCIDGRLTSSWNWTSRVAKKEYYHAFMLSGFQGFDGDFK